MRALGVGLMNPPSTAREATEPEVQAQIQPHSGLRDVGLKGIRWRTMWWFLLSRAECSAIGRKSFFRITGYRLRSVT